MHFVFDERLLRRLELDGKRLVFLAQCLADLAERRTVRVWRGDPTELADAVGPVAVTFAPVPGFRRRVVAMRDAGGSVVAHPWPHLRPPTPALIDHLRGSERFPWFRRWVQLTGVRSAADPA